MATLLAWLALVCAQVAGLPDLSSHSAEPTVVSAPAQVAVARSESGSALVKANRSSPHAKQGAGPDFLPLQASSFEHPERGAFAGPDFLRPITLTSSPLPYQARAPPSANRSDIFSDFS